MIFYISNYFMLFQSASPLKLTAESQEVDRNSSRLQGRARTFRVLGEGLAVGQLHAERILHPFRPSPDSVTALLALVSEGRHDITGRA